MQFPHHTCLMLLRNCQIACQRDCINLGSHQQDTESSSSADAIAFVHITVSNFSQFGVNMDRTHYGLNWISSMANDVGHLFHVPCLQWNVMVYPFGIQIFRILMLLLCMLDISPLSNIWFANIFPTLKYLFSFVQEIFLRVSIFFFYFEKIKFSDFFFRTFHNRSNKSFYFIGYKDFSTWSPAQ